MTVHCILYSTIFILKLIREIIVIKQKHQNAYSTITYKLPKFVKCGASPSGIINSQRKI